MLHLRKSFCAWATRLRIVPMLKLDTLVVAGHGCGVISVVSNAFSAIIGVILLRQVRRGDGWRVGSGGAQPIMDGSAGPFVFLILAIPKPILTSKWRKTCGYCKTNEI